MTQVLLSDPGLSTISELEDKLSDVLENYRDTITWKDGEMISAVKEGELKALLQYLISRFEENNAIDFPFQTSHCHLNLEELCLTSCLIVNCLVSTWILLP
jgi:hypothetical protein